MFLFDVHSKVVWWKISFLYKQQNSKFDDGKKESLINVI